MRLEKEEAKYNNKKEDYYKKRKILKTKWSTLRERNKKSKTRSKSLKIRNKKYQKLWTSKCKSFKEFQDYLRKKQKINYFQIWTSN